MGNIWDIVLMYGKHLGYCFNVRKIYLGHCFNVWVTFGILF
jgi:hypothetical protein